MKGDRHSSMNVTSTLDKIIESNNALRISLLSFIDENRSGITNRYKTKREIDKISQFITRSIVQFSTSTDQNERDRVVADRPPVSRLLSFTRSFVDNLVMVFPQSIREEVVRSDNAFHSIDLPDHWIKVWGMSKKHVDDVKHMMEMYYESFESMYGDKEIDTACLEISNQYTIIRPLIMLLDDNEILDESIVRAVCEFIVLVVLRIYTRITESPMFLVRAPAETADTLLGVSAQEDRTSDVITSVLVDTPYNTDSDIRNSDELMKLKFANMMLTFITPMIREFGIVSMKYGDITGKMRTTRVKEKDSITTYLKNIGEEHRQVEDQMKELRIGRWDVGMQKGHTRYVGTMYDTERSNVDGVGSGDLFEHSFSQEGIDGVDGVDGVDDNVDIYTQISNSEDLDMSGIPDDDDDYSEL